MFRPAAWLGEAPPVAAPFTPCGDVIEGTNVLLTSVTRFPCVFPIISFTTDLICLDSPLSRSCLYESRVCHISSARACISCARSTSYLLVTETSTR
jgi:hypothetical protein